MSRSRAGSNLGTCRPSGSFRGCQRAVSFQGPVAAAGSWNECARPGADPFHGPCRRPDLGWMRPVQGQLGGRWPGLGAGWPRGRARQGRPPLPVAPVHHRASPGSLATAVDPANLNGLWLAADPYSSMFVRGGTGSAGPGDGSYQRRDGVRSRAARGHASRGTLSRNSAVPGPGVSGVLHRQCGVIHERAEPVHHRPGDSSAPRRPGR